MLTIESPGFPEKMTNFLNHEAAFGVDESLGRTLKESTSSDGDKFSPHL